MTTCVVDVAAIAENRVDYAAGRTYAAILGANPSKGARSPRLWNAAFAAHGIDAEMVPLDIAPDRFVEMLDTLEADRRFVGGAVAVPYKETAFRWLDGRVSAEAADIGAVNCLFRDGVGRLAGTNTDGEGALRSFQARFGPVTGKSVLLLGPGGAGKAVAAFFRRAVEPGGRLMIAGRSDTGRQFAARLRCDWIDWPERATVLPRVDVVINCTSVGSASQAGSPLHADALRSLPAAAVVFDVIYAPSPSLLLTLAAGCGFSIFDGSAMNFEQAALAYSHAAPEPGGAQATRAAMERAQG